MLLIKFVSFILFLYLFSGAFLGLRHAKGFDQKIDKWRQDGVPQQYIRGYMLGVYVTAILKGPYIFASEICKNWIKNRF